MQLCGFVQLSKKNVFSEYQIHRIFIFIINTIIFLNIIMIFNYLYYFIVVFIYYKKQAYQIIKSIISIAIVSWKICNTFNYFWLYSNSISLHLSGFSKHHLVFNHKSIALCSRVKKTFTTFSFKLY